MHVLTTRRLRYLTKCRFLFVLFFYFMHLVHVVLRISWGSLWRMGVSRSWRSWARPHHAVGRAWWGTWTWPHHASWRWPWAWGGTRARCPSHRGVRSGHLSGGTGNVWLQEVPLKETLQQELRKHMYTCYSSYLKGKVFQINSRH